MTHYVLTDDDLERDEWLCHQQGDAIDASNFAFELGQFLGENTHGGRWAGALADAFADQGDQLDAHITLLRAGHLSRPVALDGAA